MKIKYLLALMIALPLCSCKATKMHRAEALTAPVNETVEIGDVINVTPRTLIYHDESKEVDGQIILPNGASKAGKSFTVEMPGVYIVNYRAIFGTHEENINIYYNCYRRSGDLFKSNNSSNRPQTGEYSFNTRTTNIQGAKLKLDSKTVFTYDGVIDFNTFSADEPFIEFMVDTAKQGSSDLESLIVRLTDVEDNNNYVDISVTDSGPIDDDGRGCYLLAGSNTQFKTGYEFGRLFTGKYGTNVGSSFRALPADSPANPASLYFNYREKALYAYPIINYFTREIITDLDDREVYGSMIWEGFKTGKATLSVFANSLSSSYANLIVTKVAGVDLTQMLFPDTEAPTIEINYDGQAPGNLPKASVNKPYKIFDATIVDNFDRDLSYNTIVTYYDSANAKTKDISVVNGTFTPKQAGTYKISYIARDYSNNEKRKTMEVIAVNDSQTMSVSLPIDTLTQLIYTEFELPSVNDVIVNGGSGKAKIRRILEDSNHKEIEIEGNTFIPDKVGTYYAYYVATDYLGQISTCSLTLNVQTPDKPVFIGEVVLPRVLIKGHVYTLPEYPCAEVVDGQTIPLTSDIYVNGNKISDNSFEAGDACNITYKVNGSTGYNEYSASIHVVDSGDPLHQDNYFYGDFNVTENKNDVTLSTSADASTLFASVLPYDNPFVKFSLLKTAIHFNELIFKFSDSKNPQISLSFKVTFEDNTTYVTIGDSEFRYELAKEFDALSEVYELSFDNSKRVLQDISHKELTVAKYDDNGNPFTGFTSGVYLDISMTGVTYDSFVRIIGISNQAMGHADIYYDVSSPIIIFNNRFINEQSYNADAYVPSVEVFDVLSDASATVTVKAPDGTIKINNKSAAVSHTFKLDAFGSYLVTYKATDSYGNFVSYPRKIVVYDFIAPELNVTGSVKEKYALNAEVSIPSYTVTDNLNDYTLDVFLILPNDEQRLLLLDKNGVVTSYLDSNSTLYNSSFKVNSNTFRAELYGRYILRYVAYDTDYNKSVVELTFVVE